MAEITIKLVGADLAARKTAAIERHKVASQIAAGNFIVVELSDVISVSYSYADELIGVLAAVNGLDWLAKNTRIIGANEHVLRVIAEVVHRRLKETGQPVKLSA